MLSIGDFLANAPERASEFPKEQSFWKVSRRRSPEEESTSDVVSCGLELPSDNSRANFLSEKAEAEEPKQKPRSNETVTNTSKGTFPDGFYQIHVLKGTTHFD